MAVWMRLLPVWGLWLGVGAASATLVRPEDGGHPLDFSRPANDPILLRQRCWRRENGGWHNSTGHCERMTPAKRLVGVFVTAFEESSFFADEHSIPAPDDPRRLVTDIELDSNETFGLAGFVPRDPNGEAYLLTFIGRRTYDPFINCYGTPYLTYVVDRLISARHLGPMKPMKPYWWRSWRPRPYGRFGGRWGKMQAETIEKCNARKALSR